MSARTSLMVCFFFSGMWVEGSRSDFRFYEDDGIYSKGKGSVELLIR